MLAKLLCKEILSNNQEGILANAKFDPFTSFVPQVQTSESSYCPSAGPVQRLLCKEVNQSIYFPIIAEEKR